MAKLSPRSVPLIPNISFVPDPYLFAAVNQRGVLFRQYVPGMDLEDLFKEFGDIVRDEYRLLNQIMYKLGRMFGVFYNRTGGWPIDMHPGNIVMSIDEKRNVFLSMIDYRGLNDEKEEIIKTRLGASVDQRN